MARIALPLIALAAAFAPIASAESKSFPAGDFTAIDTRGAVDVIFETGPDASISVEQDDGDFSDIFIEQNGQTLLVSRNSLRNKAGWARNVSLSTKNGHKVVKVNGKRVPSYTIRVTAPALEEVSVANSSSADLDAKQLAATNLDLDVSSSADATAKVLGGKLTLEASSSADATIEATGSERIEINASSSADVEISGTCQALNVSASSSADVSADDLKCVNGDILASSGGDVDAYISGKLEARASSGSDITVRGNPASRDVRESSGGDIEIKG